MPQTVSLQRGSVTFTARGDVPSNITTLFTNSASGIATRVIVNYLVVQNPYVSPSGMGQRSFNTGGFLGLVNGSASTIIGYMQGVPASPSTSVGMMNSTMPLQDASSSWNTTTNQGISFINTEASTNQVGFLNQNPASIQFSTGGGNQGYCPRNFWIGPSDSLRWWPRTSLWTTTSGKSSITNYATQTLFYSFTLITES